VIYLCKADDRDEEDDLAVMAEDGDVTTGAFSV